MASTSWKTASSFEGYYSTSGWLKNKNCYCDPLWIYGYLPSWTGENKNLTVKIKVHLLYTKSISASYNGELSVNGGKYTTYGSVNLNAQDNSFTFEIENVTAYSGAYYEFKLSFSSYHTVQCWASGGWPQALVVYTPITKCGGVTTIDITPIGSISSDSEIVASKTGKIIPDKGCLISWSGAKDGVQNTIVGYNVKYRYGNGSWTNIVLESSETNYTTDQTSLIFINEEECTSNRGKTLQFSIQTVGTKENYESSWMDSATCLINQLPKPPTVIAKDPAGNSASLYVATKNSDKQTVAFTIINNGDLDGDECTLYYKIGEEGGPVELSEPSITTSQITEETTYYFWAEDGDESSSLISKVIRINVPPVINSMGLTYSEYPGPDESKLYIKAIGGNPQISDANNHTITATWKIIGRTELENEPKIETAKNTKKLTTEYFSEEYLDTFISIKLILDDGYDSVEQTADGFNGKNFFVPAQVAEVTGIEVYTIYDDEYSEESRKQIKDNNIMYTGKKVLVHWEAPYLTPRNENYYTQVLLKRTNKVWTGKKNWAMLNEEDSSKIRLTLLEECTYPTDEISEGYNEDFTIVIQTRNSKNEKLAEVEYSDDGCILRRAPKPEFSAGGEAAGFNISPNSIRPIEGIAGDSTLDFTIPKNGGANDISELLKYSPIAEFSNSSAKITYQLNLDDSTLNMTKEANGSLAKYSFAAKNEETRNDSDETEMKSGWIEFFKREDQSQRFLFTVQAYVQNIYGDKSEPLSLLPSNNSNFYIDYRGFAHWVDSNAALGIAIQYNSDIVGNNIVTNTEIPYRVINTGEKIVFSLPKIQEYGEQEYTVVFEQNTRVEGEEWDNSNWAKISVESLDSGKYTYSIPTISNYSYCQYRAYLEMKNGTTSLDFPDSIKGGSSYAKSTESAYVITCRSDSPMVQIKGIEINQAETETELGTEQKKYTVTFILSQNTILGVSDYSCNFENYKSNWERGIIVGSNYDTKEVIYTLQWSSNGTDWEENDSAEYGITYITASTGILPEFSYNQILKSQLTLKKETTSQISDRTYFKLTARFNTGFGIYKEAVSSTFLFFPNSPTVSHRSHSVGINTNNFEDADILAMSMASGKKQIRLIGDYENTPALIYLDLNAFCLSAKLDGKDTSIIDFGAPQIKGFIIDGGTWNFSGADDAFSESDENEFEKD